LSAETITLTGDVLRLSGGAMVRFDDTSIRAAEIVVNQVTKDVEFRGRVMAFLGAGVVDGRDLPRIEFR
jgi:hypothetical protein